MANSAATWSCNKHAELSPCSGVTHLLEAQLVLYIWSIFVHISPTSPEVDAPQSVRMNDRKLAWMIFNIPSSAMSACVTNGLLLRYQNTRLCFNR